MVRPLKPLALLGAFLILVMAGGVLVLSGLFRTAPPVTVTDAVLVPMGDGLALTLAIDNPGGPDRLLGVSAEAGRLPFMNAGGAEVLAIPAGAKPSLSMDGAHAMLTGLDDAEDGRLVPVALDFEVAGSVATRARVDSAAAMSHDDSYVVSEYETAPTVTLEAEAFDGGWLIRIATTDFTFDPDAVDAAHVPGAGHAHMYLNGLKLGRVFGGEYRIGTLPPGTHSLRVALNTNDHRAYATADGPVSASVTLTAD